MTQGHEIAIAPDTSDHARGRLDRAILHGAAATAIARALSMGSSFVTLGVIARSLAKNDVGLISILVSVWLIVTMLDLGIVSALGTRLSANHGRGDLGEVRANIRHGLAVLSVLGVVVAAVGTAVALALPWERWGGAGTTHMASSLVLTLVLCGAALPGGIGVAIFTGQQRFVYAQIGLATGSLVSLVATAVVAAWAPRTDLFILALIGVPVATSWIFTGFALRSVPPASGAEQFERWRIVEMLRNSGYLAITNITNAVSLAAGTVIVGAVRGFEEAAIFSVAIRLFTPIITVVAASGGQLWPAMTNAVARGEIDWVRSRYWRGLAYVTAVSFGCSAALVLLGRPIAIVWVGRALAPSLRLLIWVGLCMSAIACTSQAALLLLGTERVRPVAIASTVATAVALLAGVLLTHIYGGSGAAAGPAIAYFGVMLPVFVWLTRGVLRELESTT